MNLAPVFMYTIFSPPCRGIQVHISWYMYFFLIEGCDKKFIPFCKTFCGDREKYITVILVFPKIDFFNFNKLLKVFLVENIKIERR